AVAQASKKPLFAIICGHLGFAPSNIESALSDFFRLADIFLSKRVTSVLKHKALVFVFPHILEYYNGILFLTVPPTELKRSTKLSSHESTRASIMHPLPSNRHSLYSTSISADC
ncbi:hypothetical protein K504DRAFT_514228, partial [Pleomassaria siparia CBS 279.74]